MCIASMDSLNAVTDGPFVSQGLRDTAALCSKDQVAIAARLKLAADVIDALLRQNAQLELAARTNKETIERMHAFVPERAVLKNVQLGVIVNE